MTDVSTSVRLAPAAGQDLPKRGYAIPTARTRAPAIAEIIAEVAKETGMTVAMLVGDRRSRPIVAARLRPVPDGSYPLRLIYYQALTPLSAEAVNWVLAGHPDIYVSRAMWRLSLMLENDARVPFWKADYDLMMNDLMGDDRNVRWAGVPTMPNLQTAIA